MRLVAGGWDGAARLVTDVLPVTFAGAAVRLEELIERHCPDIVISTGLASGQAMMPTAALACCMAALAVETMGNTPISATALRNNVMEMLLP